jgi:hypothetical protein
MLWLWRQKLWSDEYDIEGSMIECSHASSARNVQWFEFGRYDSSQHCDS